MIRTENILFLKKYFPNAWDKLRDLDYSDRASNVHAVPAKKGPLTMMIGEESPAYLHSQYDPLNEAERFIRKYDDISGYEHIFFYGVGLGYHVKALLDRHPDVSFSLYEPQPEIMYCWLSHDHLEQYPHQRLKNIFVEVDESDRQQFLINFANQVNGKVLLVVWPIYERLFKEQYQQFLRDFKEKVRDKRSSVHVNIAFKKRWMINSMLNLKHTLQTPNILHDVDKNYFKGKPAILVAAGPSLELELENIRYIKEHGLAYIFAVGSANKVLLRNEIYPDAITTYDPQESNQHVFSDIIEKKINHIPLIYGTSVGFETVENYPGPLFHMITSQDSIGLFGLRLMNQQKPDYVMDSPSIAIITLQLLYKLGCNPIILVGQNLAYFNNQTYAQSAKKEVSVRPENLSSAIKVESVDGDEIWTTPGFNRMRKEMEKYIIAYKDLKVINTTVGGAKISGTEYKSLTTVIEQVLTHRVVNKNWCVIKQNSYDINLALKKYDLINQDFQKLSGVISNIKMSLGKIDGQVKMFRTVQLQQLFKLLDKGLNKMSNNKYYQVVLLPILRMEAEWLNKQIRMVQYDTNLLEKGKKIVEVLNLYLKKVQYCMEDIKDVYNLFINNLEQIHKQVIRK